MQGRSIEKAKEALHIFLASLPSDCKFNICSFNACFDFLFDSPRPYNDQNLDDARKYTDNMVAGIFRWYMFLQQINIIGV